MLSFLLGQKTLEDQLIATRYRPSGFDYMRLVLALGVIISHVELLLYRPNTLNATWFKLLEPLAFLIVPMFFSLSGFLVAGSFERNKSLITFMGLRVFRIMPALSVEVLLSALILGPLLTTLPLQEYFAHPMLHAYFWNIIGEIHYYLPGVFEDHIFTQVNGQLWTVPYELVCYIALAVFAVFGIYRNPLWLVAAMLGCYLLQLGNIEWRPRSDVSSATGTTVVMSFIAGLLLYRYRFRLKFSWLLALGAFALSYALASVPNGQRIAPLPIAYFTVYLGLLNPPRRTVLLKGDYSYGIYLYGFPIQQAAIAISPILSIWYWHLLAVVPVVMLFAAFSWHCIEKPILGRKAVLNRLEDQALAHPAVQKSRFLQFIAAIPAMRPGLYSR